MTFNIHNQTAGLINNVAGDQRISGGQHAAIGTLDSARDAVRELRQAVAATRLDKQTASALDAQIAALEVEVRKDEPDRAAAASRLSRITDLLRSAGSLASAGAAIVGPLQTLATWLGHLGEPIARML